MKIKVDKILKVAVPVATVATTLLSSYLGKKELDEKVATKVAEALAETTKEEA